MCRPQRARAVIDSFFCPEANAKPSDHQPQEGSGGVRQRERARHGRRDGEAQAAGCVVEKGFAFQNVHQPLRNRHAGYDTRHRDRIDRRQNRRERMGDPPQRLPHRAQTLWAGRRRPSSLLDPILSLFG